MVRTDTASTTYIKSQSTYIGYYCTSIPLHNISGGFNINLQAFQAILPLCTQTLFIVGDRISQGALTSTYKLSKLSFPHAPKHFLL